jgi:hypothetical protein
MYVVFYKTQEEDHFPLGKMVEIMEELLKIKKNERGTFSHVQSSKKKEQKATTTF